MTAQASIPLKWYVPFANNDSSRVELPVTTSDPTRASQSLGFPPLTMQPPESGGVPPQGEDFNGGMNQVARICWWLLNGGGYPYDSVFASNSNINGYPNGATLQSADFLGQWISIADNNQNNPDVSGASWVPGFQYGITALTGLTGGTVTPTPAQAAKRAITLAGALTSALTIILPTWLKDWTITNGTSGAFVVIVKTLAGSGITIPQTAQPTRVSGDGTNIVQASENIAAATQATNAMQLGQATGRLIKTSVYINNAGTQQVATNINGVWTAFTATGATTYQCLANAVSVEHDCQAGGGGGGGATGSSTNSSYSGGGGAGAFARSIFPASAFVSAQTVVVGAGGAGGINTAAGSNGNASSLGALVSCPPGIGSGAAPGATGVSVSGGTTPSAAPTGSNIVFANRGGGGSFGIQLATSIGVGGPGGAAQFGAGAVGPSGFTNNGNAAVNYGAGGSGSNSSAGNTGGATGGAGFAGIQIMREFS